LIVDLDDFADVNSAHGRSAGDDALRRVASALSAVSPSSAAVFRLAGDEFAVMSRVNDRREAETLASRLRAAVPDASSPTVRLSASVGFAVSPDDAVSTNTLVDYADVALAFAKQYGGSRSVGFDHRVASALGVHARQPTEPFGAVGPNVAKALIAAYDAREPGNFRHARSVAALACLLAEELQDPSIDSERLRLAAALHDVGKIGLPSAGRVGGGAQVSNALASRAHCDLGARMLKAAHFDDVAAWVLHHHERWDGSGYPSGLSGDAIPLESRIIAIADAFDGLTSRTRLGGPMSRATALQEIDQNISARFDPNLAERFIRLVGSTPALRWTDDWPAA
jgi:diguanylate cyclase (GGDEF)-like protein/putative nucleotidyltransferase with HDIG domain